MKTASIMMTLFAFLFVGCTDKSADEHSHEAGGLEPLTYTIYSDKIELFVEFKPLVVGSTSNFAAHFTILGENFLPLKAGKVTVSLIIGEKGIRNSVDTASSPGIFRLALRPNISGTGKLIFDIETKDYKDQIVIENIRVYPNEQAALENQDVTVSSDKITYLKEQAWKVEFATAPVLKETFRDIIKTNGQIVSAPGDEIMVTAIAGGSVIFSGNKTIVGSEVVAGTNLFTISGGNISTGTIDANYKEAKANYDKAKSDFERSSELVKDNIVSQKEYLQAKVAFEKAQTVFNTIAKNYSSKGQSISSPISGFVKDILVSEGQFVQAGTPLAIISKNKRLLLQAHLSQRYFSKLSTIQSANFKMAGIDSVFTTEALNGKMVSFGKSASINSPFIPITFEINNIGKIIPGSVVEVYLKSSPILNVLIVPTSSLMEEQGYFYVYVQSGGESFEKREVKLGADDGMNVQILSGVSAGERVVTKGAYQIKLSSASGELPSHGHEH
ncbi:MAG: efflux RND transporter periplasmic adaptor subunit [Bacteroidota bacterium]|nr:efflux RND transporter periplasmic adaptor subunit [Bacteroidota bacterium]